MRCRECGTEGTGNYCAQCGAPLEEAGSRCGECGADVDPGDRYCTECGAAVDGGGSKPWTAYLPWILSGLALVSFAVAITLFLQTQTSPRGEGTITGNLPGEEAPAAGGQGGAAGPGASGSAAGPGPGSGGMPSAGELADMDPREAGDRLFDRTMRLRASGDTGRARFFARMGRRAYGRMAASELDADARFHIGLLALVQGDTAAARSRAESILEEDADHLLGLILAARSAASPDRASAYRSRFLEAAASADLDERPAYRAHRRLIESARTEFGEG